MEPNRASFANRIFHETSRSVKNAKNLHRNFKTKSRCLRLFPQGGFEPPQSEPESEVLPLHNRGKSTNYILFAKKCQAFCAEFLHTTRNQEKSKSLNHTSKYQIHFQDAFFVRTFYAGLTPATEFWAMRQNPRWFQSSPFARLVHPLCKVLGLAAEDSDVPCH